MRHEQQSRNWFSMNTLVILLILVISIGYFATLLMLNNKHASNISTTKKIPDSPSNYELSFQQSDGFFDDISNSNWKRLQKIARRTWPNHFRKDLLKYGTVSQSDKRTKAYSNWWNAENFQEEFHCQFAERIPSDSNGDGPKWVCDPHRIAKQTDCLVYSIGSSGNVMFEKGVKEQISKDCEIHTFDIEGSNHIRGNFTTALEGYATFHNWGLDIKENKKNKLKTLQQTVKELGHEGRRIDIFKIDCEWCEWVTYKQWIQSNTYHIKQILVETHSAPNKHAKSFFYDLHDAGYVIFSKEANYYSAASCVEFAFIKLSTDFFINGSLYENL